MARAIPNPFGATRLELQQQVSNPVASVPREGHPTQALRSLARRHIHADTAGGEGQT